MTTIVQTILLCSLTFLPVQYYVNPEYAIYITHPPVNVASVEWEFIDNEWMPVSHSPTVDIIRLNCRSLSHHYEMAILSHQELLQKMAANWLDPFDMWDFYMLSYYWNGTGRLQLKTVAELLRSSWL